MRKINAIRTWAVVAALGVATLATLACDGLKSTHPTQPEARNFTSPETFFVTASFTESLFAGEKTVLFTDTSTGNVTRWRWTFGDGRKSTARDPAHTYKAFGAYVVTLTVSNSISSDTVSKFISVEDVTATEDPPEEPEGSD